MNGDGSSFAASVDAEPAIAAHRGGAALWPENSLTAIRNAAALPIAQVEIDVHLAADGVPVVLHDATLDRTTTSHGPVAARSSAELARFRLRGLDEGVASLRCAATVVRDAGRVLRLEIKVDAAGRPYPGLVPVCAAVLAELGMLDRTVAIGFAAQDVAAASRAGFGGTALLLNAAGWRGLGPAAAAALCRHADAPELGLPFAECDDAAVVAAIRATGLRLGAWGLDNAAEIARGRALGLDVITTDDPVKAVAGRV